MADKLLTNLYNVLYQNKTVLKSYLSKNDINQINKFYKQNVHSGVAFSTLESQNKDLFNKIKSVPALYDYMKHQFILKTGKTIQPGICTEFAVTKSVADKLNLTKLWKFDKNQEVPSKVADFIKTLDDFDNSDKNNFRYCYYNPDEDLVLFQYGDPKNVDIMLGDLNNKIRIEIKGMPAILSDPDITGNYTESGKITPNDKFKAKHPNYLEIIEAFNNKTNIFDQESHNYSIVDSITEENLPKLLSSENDIKKTQIYLFVFEDKIYPVLPKNIIKVVNFTGSEIRPSGKNAYKVFTPEKCKQKLLALGASINDKNIVTIPKTAAKEVIGREMSVVTRIKFGSLYCVKTKNKKLKLENGNYVFPLSIVKQARPGISLHLQSLKTKESIKELPIDEQKLEEASTIEVILEKQRDQLNNQNKLAQKTRKFNK